jgi:hypothetical protein
MYAIHTIWKIRCVDEDEWRPIDQRKWTERAERTDIDKCWMEIVRHRTELKQTFDKTMTNVKRNYDKRWTELWQTLNRITMNVKRNWTDDYNRQRLQQMTTTMNGDGDKWQQCYRAIHVRKLYSDGMQKKKKKNFLFYFMFFLKFFSYSSSSSKAATRATHYMTTSSKTHRSAQLKC